jgi:hypothetical protein
MCSKVRTSDVVNGLDRTGIIASSLLSLSGSRLAGSAGFRLSGSGLAGFAGFISTWSLSLLRGTLLWSFNLFGGGDGVSDACLLLRAGDTLDSLYT